MSDEVLKLLFLVSPMEKYKDRDIFCCITACNESEEEVALSLNTFKRSSMPSLSLRKRIHIFILLDRQRDNAPDTPTLKAYKKLLKIPIQDQGSNFNCVKEDGCRIFHGFIEDIPYSLYIKGDNLISGKRYSILLFNMIVEKVSLLTNKFPRYLLFIDCDTTSRGKYIQRLINTLDIDGNCAGATGYLQIENLYLNNIIILIQQYYIYFYGHIVEKQFDNFFAKCTCLPGAFSLIKYSAFRECLVAFSQIPKNDDIKAINCLELGEDRYLTTLLLSRGYNIRYVPDANAKTFIPDKVSSYIIQQKRWFQSTFYNQIELLFFHKHSLAKPLNWGLIQWIITFFQFVYCFLSIGTISVIVSQGQFFNNFFPPICIAIGVWLYSVIFSFSVMNSSLKRTYLWIMFNFLVLTFALYYGMLGGIIKFMEEDIDKNLINYMILFLIIFRLIFEVYIIFKFSRPKDWLKLFSGLILYRFFCGLSPLITLYTFANIDNRSWGTRGISNENQGINQKDPSLWQDSPFFKENSKWKAAQTSVLITGFSKKLIFMFVLFFVNLVFILFLLNPETQEIAFFICSLILSLVLLPQCFLSSLSHAGLCFVPLPNRK
ncbi:glycosyltransferase family 2 protein [Nostoc sp. UHCC 0302]|uniref:glycosyltransferase family 2 protein n=1 Tax=Nostoc sp. UHCC 0302 TaxID=3134896 RepID=UPI00311CD493